MLRLAHALLVLSTSLALRAQATAPILVLVELPPPAESALYEVDPVSGAVSALPGLPGLFAPARAVAVDPFDGDVIVALDIGTPSGPSPQWKRLRRTGPGTWQHVTFFQADTSQLAFAGERLLFAQATSLASVHRRQGMPAVLHLQANLDAFDADAPGDAVAIAWSGRPGTAQPDSGTALVDATTGALLSTPATFANPSGRRTTGIVELPTAVPRQLLSFDDGSFATFAPSIAPTPQPLATSVAIPPGGAIALKSAGSLSAPPLALGGAAFPYLYSIDPFTGAVTIRSGALPGNPIDFAIGTDRNAHSVPFGSPCGPSTVQTVATAPPTLGSTLALLAGGQPNAILLLVLGLDDIAGFTLPMPLPFAGGCLLHVRPDALFAFATGASGVALHTFPLPGSPQFVGVPLFAQWAHLDGAGWSLGEANAYFLGN